MRFTKKRKISQQRRRKRTQQERAIRRLFADIEAWDSSSLARFIRSGWRYEEALEYLRVCREYQSKRT